MESADSASIYSSEEGKLLPAICPGCTAPGTRALPLACLDDQPPHEPVEAHFCDICADTHQQKLTRHLAIMAAATLVIIGVITAGALRLGTRAVGVQVGLALFLGGAAPWLALRLGLWKKPRLALSTAQGGRLLVSDYPKYWRVLQDHGFDKSTASISVSLRQRFGESFLLATLSLIWLGLVHSLGGADVRVLVAGEDGAVLLVDSRHHGHVDPTGSEDPRAGREVRVLGGRRRFELVSDSGITLGGETRTIWPGRTYIVGHLAHGQCLYWEKKKYGSDAPSLLMPLGGTGPIWELRAPVDSWFIPLAPSHQRASGESTWESSGGSRKAIRLLPCRAQAHP